jgi:hypothetical protein
MRRLEWFLVVQILCVCPFFGGYARQLPTDAAEGGADYTLYNIYAFSSFSTGGQTPFWMVSNRYGVAPLKANSGYLQAQVFHRRSLGSRFGFYAGIDMAAATRQYRSVSVQQLFAELAYDWLCLNIGSRGGADYHVSLMDASLSSGDMVLSPNARPIPEINLYASRFVNVPWTGGWLQVKGNFAVGRSFDADYLESFRQVRQDYIRHLLWHHKSFYFRINDTEGDFPVSMVTGLRHMAQWGGVSTNPVAGTQPHSLKDFMRIVIGKSGGNDASLSDQINVLGNHYGAYDVRLGYAHPGGGASLYVYYQHFFDDASGLKFDNSLDGLMGVQVDISACRWLNRILIERLNTMNQSGAFHFIDFDHDKYPGYGGGGDNYYNNGEYTTGASYFNRSTGSPLLVSPEYNADGRLGFRHNRVVAWHLGAEGRMADDVSYRLLCSNVEGYGTAYAPALKRLRTLSFATEVSYSVQNSWQFSVTLAADKGDLLGDHLGIGISVTKTGFLQKK